MVKVIRFYIAVGLGRLAIYIAPPSANFRIVRKINWR